MYITLNITCYKTIKSKNNSADKQTVDSAILDYFNVIFLYDEFSNLKCDTTIHLCDDIRTNVLYLSDLAILYSRNALKLTYNSDMYNILYY